MFRGRILLGKMHIDEWEDVFEGLGQIKLVASFQLPGNDNHLEQSFSGKTEPHFGFASNPPCLLWILVRSAWVCSSGFCWAI